MTLLNQLSQRAKFDPTDDIRDILNVEPNTEAGGFTPRSSGGVSVRIHSDICFSLDYHDGREFLYQVLDGHWRVVAGVEYDNGYPDREPQWRTMLYDGSWSRWQDQPTTDIETLAQVEFRSIPSDPADRVREKPEFAAWVIRCQELEAANKAAEEEYRAEQYREQQDWEAARYYLHLMSIAKQSRKRSDLEAAWAYWGKLSEAERALTKD